MRLRFTAGPQPLETISPSRGGPAGPGELTMTTPPCRRRVPFDRTLRKSRGLRRDVKLGSEPLPALGATILDRRPAGAGTHARAESVTALPAANFWLVGPLHGESKGGRGGTRTEYGGTASFAILMVGRLPVDSRRVPPILQFGHPPLDSSTPDERSRSDRISSRGARPSPPTRWCF